VHQLSEFSINAKKQLARVKTVALYPEMVEVVYVRNKWLIVTFHKCPCQCYAVHMVTLESSMLGITF